MEIGNDKILTGNFIERVDLQYPKTFSSLDAAFVAIEGGELEFPLVIKPRFGMGSIGVNIADDKVVDLEVKVSSEYLYLTFNLLLKDNGNENDGSNSVTAQSYALNC